MFVWYLLPPLNQIGLGAFSVGINDWGCLVLVSSWLSRADLRTLTLWARWGQVCSMMVDTFKVVRQPSACLFSSKELSRCLSEVRVHLPDTLYSAIASSFGIGNLLTNNLHVNCQCRHTWKQKTGRQRYGCDESSLTGASAWYTNTTPYRGRQGQILHYLEGKNEEVTDYHQH